MISYMACSARRSSPRIANCDPRRSRPAAGSRNTRIDSPSFRMRSGPGFSRCCTPTWPFFDAHQRGIVLVFDGHVEDRAAHRNHRGRRAHAVVIRLPAQLLDVDLHASQQDIQQVPPGAGILAEDDPRVGENFEGTAVGNLEDRETVWSGYDDLARLHRIADIQHPGGVIAQYGNLSVQGDDLGGAASGRRLGRQQMHTAANSSQCAVLTNLRENMKQPSFHRTILT